VPKVKLILLGLVAVLALNGVAASSASAFSWWIENAEKHEEVLKTGVVEEFNKEGTVPENFTLKFDGNTVTCTGLEYKKGFIEGLRVLAAESVELKKCAIAPTTCVLATGEIKTAPLTSEIALVSKKVEFELKPTKEKGPVAEFTLTGETCALAGKQVVKGGATGVVLEAEKLTKIKTLQIDDALTVGSFSAEFKGEGTYSASKGWSAH
jgi:hypothetical protein